MRFTLNTPNSTKRVGRLLRRFASPSGDIRGLGLVFHRKGNRRGLDLVSRCEGELVATNSHIVVCIPLEDELSDSSVRFLDSKTLSPLKGDGSPEDVWRRKFLFSLLDIVRNSKTANLPVTLNSIASSKRTFQDPYNSAGSKITLVAVGERKYDFKYWSIISKMPGNISFIRDVSKKTASKEYRKLPLGALYFKFDDGAEALLMPYTLSKHFEEVEE